MGKDFLKIIVEHKKSEVEAARRDVPEQELRRKAAEMQNRRPFLKALQLPGPSGVNIIAEIKRASPSKGDIRIDLDPAEYAAAYEKGGAAAISVLTDHHFFKGGFNDFKKARQATCLPMLRKDFLISEYQVYESAVLGADAVLLIARILTKQQLRDYLQLSSELKMDALVEIHSEDDLNAANYAGAKLIGINNRNLSSFDTDLGTAIALAALLEKDQIAVAASGIHSADDIRKNKNAGIYNFLIGESLVRAENPQTLLESLRKV